MQAALLSKDTVVPPGAGVAAQFRLPRRSHGLDDARLSETPAGLATCSTKQKHRTSEASSRMKPQFALLPTSQNEW
jgi:hypothetical protein